MSWHHLQTILWLRWRLTRNQWTRSQGLGAVVAVAMGAASLLGGLASFAGGIVTGWFLAPNAPPAAIPLVEVMPGHAVRCIRFQEEHQMGVWEPEPTVGTPTVPEHIPHDR